MGKKTAIILGNGESRKGVDYRKEYPGAFVYGCNGAYKEKPDALVCTDAYMQHIIYDTGYCKNNLCAFSEWNPVPADAAEVLAENMGLPVIRNKKNNCELAQVAGSEKYIYITYVENNDCVLSIPEVMISSGSRALSLACQSGQFNEILLLGFDGMGATNIFQQDKGYERSTPRAEWIEERESIIRKYKNINIRSI